METIAMTLAILVMVSLLVLMGILLLNMVLEEWDRFKDNIKHAWRKNRK
jgi:hypothetical protein|tara:strand:- start:365 stop:511 length:147 start_codon:yes stop_codon:yes gene_type:complete